MFNLKDDEAHRSLELAKLLRRLVQAPLSAEEIEAAQPVIDAASAEDVATAIDIVIGEGRALSVVDPAVSKLVNLLGSTLGRRDFAPEDPFFASLVSENAKIRGALDALRPTLAALNRASGRDPSALRSIVEGIAGLSPIAVHYEKKENVLFPVFEKKHPHWRCVTLMWSMHDRVREEMATIAKLAREEASPDLAALNASFGRLFFAAFAILFREERILFPLVSSLLSRAERFALYDESKALGFAFLGDDEVAVFDAEAEEEDFTQVLPAMPPKPGSADASATTRADGYLSLDAGSLLPSTLDALLKALTVDLTFIDADDRVAWFSNGPHRIFPRSPAIIGRDVRNCHPAASVDRVMDLIESFRSGRRDSEEFWIGHRGRFVHIRYVALRDADGAYLGTLESSQDISELRALEGEKRLARISHEF
ncbi:MAG TPA: PAS domain-containing protein [Rectinemataceae bacterium]|nr:PAS domain-containing protein [Rectinemataceae bacterium]